jgi:hypothetical protein
MLNRGAALSCHRPAITAPEVRHQPTGGLVGPAGHLFRPPCGRLRPDTRHQVAYGEIPSSPNEVEVVMAAPTPVTAPGRQ